MAKYDDASWHYDGEYPNNLPNENAAIHIGMFITWCIEKDFMSEDQNNDFQDEIQKVKNYKMTGRDFLIKCCDEKFSDYDLCKEGNAFAEDYYNNDTGFSKNYSSDFCGIFNKYETIYHVEDTWENYELIKKVIDKRFEEWKEYLPEKSI